MPPPHVIVAYGTMDLATALAQAQQAGARGAATLVVGITRYQTYHEPAAWRVCLSWQGAQPTWISAHRRKRAAEQQLLRVCDAAHQLDGPAEDSVDALRTDLARYGDRDLAHHLGSAHETENIVRLEYRGVHLIRT